MISQEVKYQARRIQRTRELYNSTRDLKWNQIWNHPEVKSETDGHRRQIAASVLWHNIKVARTVINQLPVKPYRRNAAGALEMCFIWDSGFTAKFAAEVIWREVSIPRGGAYAPRVLPLP